MILIFLKEGFLGDSQEVLVLKEGFLCYAQVILVLKEGFLGESQVILFRRLSLKESFLLVFLFCDPYSHLL